ncbi:MAG: hypothetical protein Q9219_004101 [cf. Caloplaca sp. 3 TL-2023]
MGVIAVPKLENYPRGFPRLACFLSSDDGFMVYKRFGIVFSRLLLNKQDELRELEAKLLVMDRKDEVDTANDGARFLMSRYEDVMRHKQSPPVGFLKTRPQLLKLMEEKILEYSELLLKANQLNGLKKPSPRDYRSVLRYMVKDNCQLFEEESAWILDMDDLVTLQPGREYAWLDKILERVLSYFGGRIVKVTNAKTDDPIIHYYDRGRISMCITLLLTLLLLILLMVPIWWLYHTAVHGKIASTANTIVVILSSTVIFSMVLSAFTKAHRHEIVAASAGYCAVLVVFLGNIQS